MTLYTSKVIAQWLCLTERRVRQLRDEGVIVEARPGLYELQPTVARYIKYLGGAGKENLNTERMKLTAEKRKAAEMDNDLRRGDLHSTQDIEKGIQTMCLNIRSRFLAMPAKLFVTFATGTVKPIIQDVFTFITGTVLPIILQTFTAAAPTIASIISNIGSAVMTGMQIIGSAIQAAMPIIQGIITVIMTIGSVVVPALLAGFEAFSAGISAVMSAIQGFFQGLITFITGVFSGSWSQAWEGIKQIFGSAFDGLVALCKAPLNAVIAIINKAISGINGLGLTIPKWVPILGGKSFSVNIPTLPMLARGGFTDGVSIAGEAGTEAVISFQRGVRSDNINTWTQAGRMLGVSGEQAAVAAGVPYADGGGAVELATIEATQGNNAVELQEIDTGKPQPEQGGSGTPDGGGQVVFAPQIVVQGNADRAVLESVLDDAQQRFELWYEQMMRRKARTAY